MNKNRMIQRIIMVSVMLIVGNFTVFAASTETRTPIYTVAVNIQSLVEEGNESVHATVTSTSSQFSVGNIEWSSVPDEGYAIGEEPKIKVYLHARNGQYFEKSVSKKTVIANGGELTAVKKEDEDETLVLSITLAKVKGTLEDTLDADWVGYPLGKVEWQPVENAKAYELKLYHNDQVAYSVEKSVGTTFDFYPFMVYDGHYTFKVRAIPVNSEESTYMTPGEWGYSGTQTISAEDTYSMRNQQVIAEATADQVTTPTSLGWAEFSDGWKYRGTNGEFITNTWKHLDGAWHYFGYDGFMYKNWQMIDGGYYYFNTSGHMQVGWVQYEKEWYYLNPSTGAMQSGWIVDNGRWYYLSPSTGAMETGWILINNQWHYLDGSQGGALATNRYIDGYYVNENGFIIQ